MKYFYPDYETIMMICKGKMINNQKVKRNSWKNLSDLQLETIIKIRLKFLNNHSNLFDNEKIKNFQELFNIVNFCCFYIQNMWDERI